MRKDPIVEEVRAAREAYAKGAFDAKTGLSHGWRQTPRLRHLGVTSYAPSLTLRSVER